MIVHHLALVSDWQDALATGVYSTSTLGRSLEQEGFIHCSQEHQLPGVFLAFYTDVTEPLVVLDVDTDRLRSPWRLDEVPGADEPFPHVYGPIVPGAVLAAELVGPDHPLRAFKG